MISAHERLLEYLPENFTAFIIKAPYRNSTNTNYTRKVNCLGFDQKIGRPLVEHEDLYYPEDGEEGDGDFQYHTEENSEEDIEHSPQEEGEEGLEHEKLENFIEAAENAESG